MNKRFFKNKKRKGFTLIEMVGVLAVVAILGSFVAPKVFEVIEGSKSTRFALEIGTYSKAVANWYKDIGSLQSLNGSGVLAATDTSFQAELIANAVGTTGLWAFWNGPYINSVANLSLGTALTIETNTGASGTAAAVKTDTTSWDLDDDDKNDMASKQVVALKLTGVTDAQASAIDNIIDKGLTAARFERSGKVKYDADNDNLYIYLASL